MREPFDVPDAIELLEFFGSEPVEASPCDGYWLYETSDSVGVTLRFSFDVLERSVQTCLEVEGAILETVSHEAARSISIDATTNELVARCEDACSRTTLRITLGDRIRCCWATLACS